MAPQTAPNNLSETVASGIIERVTSDIPGLIASLPPQILTRIETLVIILQAAGIAFIIYVAYLLVRFIIGWKQAMLIKHINEKVDQILEKIERIEQKKKPKKKKDENKTED